MYALVLLVLLVSATDKPVKKQNPPHTKNESSQAKRATPSPSASPSATIQNPKSDVNGDADRNPPNDRTYKVEVEKTPPDWWMRIYVIVTGLIAAFGLGTLFLIRHQRDVMKEQLAAMQEQLAEMKTAREQTIGQMTAAGEQTKQLIEQATQQAANMKIAAEAAKDSAEAALRGIKLQEVLNKQWVDFDLQGVKIKGERAEGTDQFMVVIATSLINPTTMPLTINGFKVTAGKGRTNESRFNVGVPPNQGIPIGIPIRLSNEQVDHYRRNQLAFNFIGAVFFTDAFGQPQEQPFGFTVHSCGMGGGVIELFQGTLRVDVSSEGAAHA
jgi:hypothetical protein